MKDLEVIQENMDLLTEPKHASVQWGNSTFHVLRLRKNCEENRMICERFLSDYREIFEAQPRKSRDNHSKTSNRSSCLLNSLLEKS